MNNANTCITCAVWNTVVSPPFASGAFGRVYRGSVDGQDVAVKTIRSEEWAIGMRATVYLYLGRWGVVAATSPPLDPVCSNVNAPLTTAIR